MRISVGIDIAKEAHWVTAVDADGVVRIDRKLANTPAAIAGLIDELKQLGGTVRIGLDVVGGIAGLVEAMLADAGFALVHVPGLAVNRARQGTVGGAHKSDPRDARVIAEQVRIRQDLRPIEPAGELDLELRLLVGRRRDLVAAQTQRLARLHDLLVGIFPGLEQALDLTAKGPLALLTKLVTPAELRAAGKKRLVRHLKAAGGSPKVEALAEHALGICRLSLPQSVLSVGGTLSRSSWWQNDFRCTLSNRTGWWPSITVRSVPRRGSPMSSSAKSGFAVKATSSHAKDGSIDFGKPFPDIRWGAAGETLAIRLGAADMLLALDRPLASPSARCFRT